MLVIRRRAGEIIQIGEHIELEVLEIASGRVTLGVRAPRSVPVLRKEILLTACANRAAAETFSTERMEELAAQLRRTASSR